MTPREVARRYAHNAVRSLLITVVSVVGAVTVTGALFAPAGAVLAYAYHTGQIDSELLGWIALGATILWWFAVVIPGWQTYKEVAA